LQVPWWHQWRQYSGAGLVLLLGVVVVVVLVGLVLLMAGLKLGAVPVGVLVGAARLAEVGVGVEEGVSCAGVAGV
jgi:hypothetical protein